MKQPSKEQNPYDPPTRTAREIPGWEQKRVPFRRRIFQVKHLVGGGLFVVLFVAGMLLKKQEQRVVSAEAAVVQAEDRVRIIIDTIRVREARRDSVIKQIEYKIGKAQELIIKQDSVIGSLSDDIRKFRIKEKEALRRVDKFHAQETVNFLDGVKIKR